MSEYRFSTITEGKRFEKNNCDLKFLPTGVVTDGLNLIVIKFVQNLLYGKFNGECMVDGELITIDNVLGTVEHVSSRY